MTDKPARMTDKAQPLTRLAQQRVEYGGDLGSVASTPGAQFRAWYEAAYTDLYEPNAMVVATADDTGPTARLVLLKSFDADGFVFYTHYTSPKGQQIERSPLVSLIFPWHELARQVRVRAVAEKVSEAESDIYFAQRPRGSQIGAVASRQSQPVADRDEIERRYAQAVEEFADQPVARPATWGGYRVRPVEVEFWQGRDNRMHDRFVYTSRDGRPASLDDPEAWNIARLEP